MAKRCAEAIVLWLGMLFLLSACGGGGSGGGNFENQGAEEIKVSISADKTTLATNPYGVPPLLDSPYTNTITVQAQTPNSKLQPSTFSVVVTPTLDSGALYYLDSDPAHKDANGVPLAYRSIVLNNTSGLATAHFHAFGTPGKVTLTASTKDPNTGRTISDSIDIVVSDQVVTGKASITIIGPKSLSLSQTGDFTLTLLDPAGIPISGQTLSVTSAKGNQISNASPVTDSNGQAKIQIKATTVGTDTIAVSGVGVQGSTTLIVSSLGSLVQLLVSSPQLPSASTIPVTLTALVKDSNNNLLPGANVAFAADNDGAIQVIRGTTDQTGTAQAQLTTPGNKSNRTINLTASYGGITSSTQVQVVGTRIDLTGPKAIPIGQKANYTLTLVDSAGNPITGQTLSITSANGNQISNPSPVTDAGGQATVQVTATVAGTDTLTVTGLGVVATVSLAVLDTTFVIIPQGSANVNAIPLGTPGLNFTVQWAKGTPPVPQAGATINLSTSRGTLSANTVATGANGITPVVNVSSANSAGPAVITATAVNGPSTQLAINFVATTVDNITLQADPAVIGTNPADNKGEQSLIVATLRDANGNLVANKTVNFSIIQDVTGGTLAPSTAVTNAVGQASTTFTPGPSPSAKDGVVIQVLEPQSGTSATVNLTVAEKKLFITLGTGNTISESADGALYILPYSVLVTDAAGNKIANAKVTLSIVSRAYSKGKLIQVSTPDCLAGGTEWILPGNIVTCPNEDFLSPDQSFWGNGKLDPGEDINNNGRLDPGDVATTSVDTVTTDSNGFGIFNVRYAQQYALWVKVELTARTLVSGSEASTVNTFVLPGYRPDYLSCKQGPPAGVVSPYGVGTSCLDPN